MNIRIIHYFVIRFKKNQNSQLKQLGYVSENEQ